MTNPEKQQGNPTSDTDTINTIRQECWNQAIYTYGTAWIFEQRARWLGQALRILTFLGIVVPITVGGVVLSFGINYKYLGQIVAVAGALGVAQLVGSVWSLVAKWEDSLAYARQSISANHRLSDLFESLAKNPPTRLADLRLQFELLQAENRFTSSVDYQQVVIDKEKRAGLRAGLIRFQRSCVKCGIVPASMKPSDCEVCGRF